VFIEYGTADQLEGGGGSLLPFEGDTDEWRIHSAGSGEELQLRIASHLDMSRAMRLRLALSVPMEGVVYKIPVVIMPMAGETLRRLFKPLVGFLVLLVIFVAGCEIWHLSKGCRGATSARTEATRPRGEQQPAEGSA
jgi:hypothetical protein